MSTQNWSTYISDVIKNLENKTFTSETDRLNMITELEELLMFLTQSLTEWHKFIANPFEMETLTKEELQEIFSDLKNPSLQFLNTDLKWTKFFMERSKKQKTKRKIFSPNIGLNPE